MGFLKVEPYGTVKLFYLSSVIWFVVGAFLGLIDATHMTAPEMLGNIPWIVFSRSRPMHVNAMVYGFVGAGLLGAAQFLVPTLVRSPLWSERLGKASLWVWNLSVGFGITHISLGYSQGREYAEFLWISDIGILTSFAMIFYNALQTVLRREEKILYVSVWYVLASIVFTWFIYFFGNAVWNPGAGAIAGMPDAILAWFYGHGIIGLFLTPLAIAIAYYVIPNVARSPIYSHTLSLVGFWSLLIIYTHIGTHHLLQTPAPTWLKILAVSGSIAMVIPVFTVLINLWLTLRGRLGLVHADIGGKFVMMGLVWYIFTCLQGPLQSLPVVQRITHLNNWVIAHSHMGIFGFSGIIVLGGMYYILPRITGRPIHNTRLADVQYWLLLMGMGGFFLVLTAGGLVQGHSWLNGETVYRTVSMLHPYLVVRGGLGILIFFGAVIGLYNVYMTLYGARADRNIQ